MPAKRQPAQRASRQQFAILCDGKRYVIEVDDLDRHEWRDIKTALGMSQMEVLGALASLDLDTLAAVLWRVRRREESELALDDVNLRLKDVFDADEDGASADPPD